jgi:alpha-1,3-glucosyltransferase
MELTLHLPPTDWYRNTSDNDLAYWGLDYPPLSAYQSLLHGRIINASLPDAVALRSSRGYESTESYMLRFNRLLNSSLHAESCVVKTCCCFGSTRKLLMRWTVLSSDLLVFFPAALWFVWAYLKGGIGITGEERREGWMWLLAMVLISPCLVLIDHGHFQVSYTNDVCD